MKLKSPVSRLRRKFFSSLFKLKRRKNRRVYFTRPKMSVLDNNEIGATVEVDLHDEPALANVFKATVRKEPKRILHFSDGTMEEYDSEDSEEELPTKDMVEEPFRKAKEREVEAAPAIDPKTLTWPAWFKYYTVAGGSKTLSAMDRMGEGVAYYLGITTPKYQYEIDEYYRARDENLAAKKEEAVEFETWRTPSNKDDGTTQVITEEQKPMHPPPV